MGKTERILNNLPATFRPYPRPTVLFTLASALGGPMQDAENLLVEAMKAHWVDHADQSRDEIRDLALLAALFNLSPRQDESVEAFREHLKRYIQTFLNGTATIRGILRLAADTLGITAGIESLRTPLEICKPGLPDAADLLFGARHALATGADAQPAMVKGAQDISAGVDLRAARRIRLRIDGNEKTVDLGQGAANLQAVQGAHIAALMNNAFEQTIAHFDGQALNLVSPTPGSAAVIELLEEVDGDASGTVFGIQPRANQGASERCGAIRGTVDLSAGIDPQSARYLRVSIDHGQAVEIDFAAAGMPHLSADQVREAINTTLGLEAASIVDGRLEIQSPTSGPTSSVEILNAPAQDAAPLLLGANAAGLYAGAAARPARLVGRTALNQGVDLSQKYALVLAIDGADPVEINCAGNIPAQTTLDEIVDRINTRVPGVASHNGLVLLLESTTRGEASRLEVLSAVEGDAAERILGFLPRRYNGEEARPAHLSGTVDLRPDVDLRWRQRVYLAVDGANPEMITLAGPDAGHVSPEAIAAAINARYENIAALENGRLRLTSPTSGAGSRLEIAGSSRSRPTSFTTQAPILDEASPKLFGQIEMAATGAPAAPATWKGTPDLSRGVDLREKHDLCIGVDDQAPVIIDLRGNRARVTLLEEIVEKLQSALPAAQVSTDGQHVTIQSKTTGLASRVVVEAAATASAAPLLLGVESAVALGQDSQPVTFHGLTDLSLGLDVVEHYLVKIGIDDGDPVQIDLRESPQGIPDLPEIFLTRFDLANRINDKLGAAVAYADSKHLNLRSPSSGAVSRIRIDPPDDLAHDATARIFGVTPGRMYQGSDPQPAEIRGLAWAAATLDLSARGYLRVGSSAAEPRDIRVAGQIAAETTLEEVAAAIENALGAGSARVEDNRLILTTAAVTGSSAMLVVEPSLAADATGLVLGDGAGVHKGTAASPAILTGELALNRLIDLSGRGTLRIAVDGQPAQDVPVSGHIPRRTMPEEVVAAINTAYPGLASLDAQHHLQLKAAQSVAVLPLRFLTLIEYPPAVTAPIDLEVTHGSLWTVENQGMRDVPARLTVTSRLGVVAPTFTNHTMASRIHFPGIVEAGQTLEIGLDADGQPYATLDGDPYPIETTYLAAALSLPPGSSQWQYTECYASRFDMDTFDTARFAGGQCRTYAIFDLSRFVGDGKEPEVAVFASGLGVVDAGVHVRMDWAPHLPGRFELVLPYDLERKYGGRFDEARFAEPAETPQAKGLFLEMTPDEGSLLAWLAKPDRLVTGTGVTRLPPGVTALPAPLARPIRFSGGTASEPAQLAITEEGLGGFILLRASAPGEWGNALELTLANGAAPGTYDLSLGYAGEDTFENAVQIVREQVIQARAAGVEASVTRQDRAC